MSAGEAARAWLEEHGPIHRADGSALTFLADQLAVQSGTLGLALRRMATASPPTILRRTKGLGGKGGTTWIGLPSQVDQEPAEEPAPPLSDHPDGWTAGCGFCEREPQRACALHRPPVPGPAAEPEEAPTSVAPAPAPPPVAEPEAEPERVATVTALPTPRPARPGHPSTRDVEPEGLREEFIALQERYATLVDELAGMKQRVLDQAEKIGELRAQKARLMAQVAALSAELRQAS